MSVSLGPWRSHPLHIELSTYLSVCYFYIFEAGQQMRGLVLDQACYLVALLSIFAIIPFNAIPGTPLCEQAMRIKR
jgi:hypothetical protein